MHPHAGPLLEALFAQSEDLVVLLDHELHVVERSASWRSVFGETTSFLDTLLAGSRNRGAREIERRAHLHRSLVLVHLDSRGRARRVGWRQVSAKGLHLLLGRDLTEDDRRLDQALRLRQDSQRNGAEIRRLADTDPLTGVANRRATMAAAEWVWAREPVASAVLVDLDNFKRINDTYGHDAGDAMIRAASEVLQGAAGPGAVLGRWGGEEFACIFAGDASTIGDAMLDALRTMRLDGGDVSLAITGSIGVAVVSDTTQVPVSDALAAADAAMYEAKAAGRDCVRVRHLLPRTPTDPDGAPGERRAPRKWKLRKA